MHLIEEIADELSNGHLEGPTPPGTPNLDLTDAGSSGVINDAVFMTGELPPSGSGQVTTFLEIRDNHSERGYNSDAHHPEFDEKAPHTSSLLLADVPIVFGDGSSGTAEGVAYREFLLELSEASGSKQFLSLDALQIWQEESGDLTDFTPGAGFDGAHTNYLAYDLNAGGDQWIALSDDLPQSWFQTDYRILIPDSAFINDSDHRFVTLYSELGIQGGGWKSDGGSEKWRVHEEGDTPTSLLTISKTATIAGGTADAAGEVIGYAITVGNNGSTALTGITVTDPPVSDLAAVESGGFNAGDADQDGALDLGETWQYTASHTVTQAEIDAGGSIDNTASVTTDQGAMSSDGASVAVVAPLTLTFGTSIFVDHDEDGLDSDGDLIEFVFSVTNAGSETLSSVTLDDPLLGGTVGGPDSGDDNSNNLLDAGETWTYSENYFLTASDVTAHHVLNEATVAGLDPSSQVVSVTAQIDFLLP